MSLFALSFVSLMNSKSYFGVNKTTSDQSHDRGTTEAIGMYMRATYSGARGKGDTEKRSESAGLNWSVALW